MYRFISDPLSFRLSAWPYGGSSYSRVYNYRKQNTLWRPLLDYLEEELLASPTLRVRRNTFTLVSVYSKFTNMSYGLTGSGIHPVNNLSKLARGPIVFTFAMTTKDTTFLTPEKIIWNTGMTALWGPNLQYSRDFLTISVPLNIAMRCRLNNTLLPQMEQLYKIVGGWSKAIAMHKESAYSLDPKLTHDKIYFRNIPQAMWQYPWDDWKYVRDFWDRMPNLLRLNLDSTFATYFLRYLTRYFRRSYRTAELTQFFNDLERYVRSGVLDAISQTTSSQADVVKEFFVVPDRQESYDVERIVRQICTGKS